MTKQEEGYCASLPPWEQARYIQSLQEPFKRQPLAVNPTDTNICAVADYLRTLLAQKLKLSESVITKSSTFPIDHDLAFEIAMFIGANGRTNGEYIMASDCLTVGAVMSHFA